MLHPFTVQLKESDHVAACFLHAFGTWPYLLAWALFGIVGYAVQNVPQVPDDVQFVGLMVAAASAGIVGARLIIAPISIWWRAPRLFRESKSLHEPFQMVWDDKGLLLTAASWSTKTAWSDYLKFRQGKDHILLYVNRSCFHIIPKRAFSDDASRVDFERTVRAKVVAA